MGSVWQVDVEASAHVACQCRCRCRCRCELLARDLRTHSRLHGGTRRVHFTHTPHFTHTAVHNTPQFTHPAAQSCASLCTHPRGCCVGVSTTAQLTVVPFTHNACFAVRVLFAPCVLRRGLLFAVPTSMWVLSAGLRAATSPLRWRTAAPLGVSRTSISL